uniref:COMMD1 N-terminal domain-containing protein n=1 Tax=Mola mola TaxID=94237 RepID=A0A3Q3XF90_MOLML
MADAESAKALSGLLNGIAQREFHNKVEVTEELLNTELYPELSRDQFTALHDRMRGLLKSIATADMDHAQLEAFLTAQTSYAFILKLPLHLFHRFRPGVYHPSILFLDVASLKDLLMKALTAVNSNVKIWSSINQHYWFGGLVTL